AAREKLEESNRLFTALGNKQGIAGTAIQVGIVLLESGNLDDVDLHVQEGLQIAKEIGDRRCEMYALDALARLAGKKEDRQEAHALFLRSAAIAHESNDTKHLADVLFHYGILLRRWEELEAAYRLVAVAERVYIYRHLYNATQGHGVLR